MLKLDVMQVVTDARGRDFSPKDVDAEDSVRIRDLIYMAMGDEPSPNPAQGVPPPQAPEKEKRQRFRISVEVYAVKQGDMWEVSREDADYIIQRAAVMLTTPAFGRLDHAVSLAIGVSAASHDTPAEGAPIEPPAG